MEETNTSLCSAPQSFCPHSFFQTFRLLISTTLFLGQVCLFLAVRSFSPTSKLILDCFQYLLPKNLRVVDLISIRIWLRIGWNFFHTHTPEGIKWIYLKDSYVLQGLSDLCYFSGSSLFLPFDTTEHLFQGLPLCSSAMKPSAWHWIHTHLFVFSFSFLVGKVKL